MKKYLFIKPIQFFIYSIVAVIAALIGMSMAFVMSSFVNLLNGGTMEKLVSVFTWSMIWLFANLLFDGLSGYLKNQYLRTINSRLRQDLFEKIMGKSIVDFNKKNSAVYIAELNTNIENLNANYFKPVLNAVYTFANLIGAFISMLLIDTSTIYIIMVLMILSFFVPMLAEKYIQKRSMQYLGGIDAYTARLKDYLNGFMVIKTFSLFDKINSKHKFYNEDMENKKMSQSNLYIILREVAMCFGLISTIAAMAYGVYLTLIGRTQGGAIMAMGHLIGNVSGAFSTVTDFVSQLNSAKPVISRFNEILNTNTEFNDKGEVLDKIESIKFDNLSFGYDEENTILNGMSVTFEKGKSYALVGESGSGKSTMFNLMLRYYDNFKGELSVNGEDIRNYNYKSIYSSIGWIGQNVFLFEDTILNNLTLYNKVSDEILDKAIKFAKLDEFINSLPKGIDTMITENGANLSGGQRQRFALARAFINNPDVYLLDEFTSSLDMQTGAEIEKGILKENDKTIIHITHKLIPEMLKKYDEILVLKEGKIIEQGSYGELMKKKAYFFGLQNLSRKI